MDLQSTVKQALTALYHHPEDAVRMDADRWLQDFQRTIDAWQVADNLLHDATSNLETLIFCSPTLRSKVQRDFEELPSEAFLPLQDSLNTLLKKFHKGPQRVRTHISIALAAVAVHVPAEDWGDGGILSWLKDEMNSQQEFIPGFLELLTEVFNYKIAARSERRSQFERQLTSEIEVALNVLDAFASWLRLRHGQSTTQLHSFVSELIHYSSRGSVRGFSQHMPLIQVVVPQDEEDVKAVARLFSDMGDSYVELIGTGSDEAMLILNALLEIAAHPEDSYVSFGDEMSIEAERKRRLQVFRSSYESLVSLVIFRIQYPQDYQELTHENLKDFRHTRFAVAYVLTDAASVLGGESTLSILFTKFVEAMSSCGNGEQSEWRPADASLYGIRAIERYVSAAEAEIMPQIMSMLAKLPRVPQLLQTVCLTIGAYSKWLDASPSGLSFCPSVVDIIMSGMVTSEDTAASAALAIRHISDDCRKKLCGSLDGLFHIYQSTVNGTGNFKVSPENSLHLVEALSMETLCLPVVTPLQEIIHQGPEVINKKIARELTVHIDRFAYIFSRAWDMRTMDSLCRACKYAVRISGRYMGITIGAMLQEIQSLYQQHHQPCFLYLSSEVIKEFTARPDIADDCFLLASRCIRYCPHLFIASLVEASNSILSFLSDIFDMNSSKQGEQFVSIRESIIILRGANITRILIASLTGALPSSRIEMALQSLIFLYVTYALLSFARVYGLKALEWAKETASLIPLTALTEVERSKFLQALYEISQGAELGNRVGHIEEISYICRRNRTVKEIVQAALRPLECSIPTPLSQSSWFSLVIFRRPIFPRAL
uniref:Uncharacterized protein n=1 Tax=Kalanchoe fedtschenkoi TaxID=63787 RepID=A0A7N0U001_KALFE